MTSTFLKLSSENKDKLTSIDDCNFTYKLNCPINNVSGIKIHEIILPFTYHILNESNNKLYWEELILTEDEINALTILHEDNSDPLTFNNMLDKLSNDTILNSIGYTKYSIDELLNDYKIDKHSTPIPTFNQLLLFYKNNKLNLKFITIPSGTYNELELENYLNENMKLNSELNFSVVYNKISNRYNFNLDNNEYFRFKSILISYRLKKILGISNEINKNINNIYECEYSAQPKGPDMIYLNMGFDFDNSINSEDYFDYRIYIPNNKMYKQTLFYNKSNRIYKFKYKKKIDKIKIKLCYADNDTTLGNGKGTGGLYTYFILEFLH